ALSNWEQDDPCAYVSDSCKGKFFGKKKSCNARKDRSKALCVADKRKQEEHASLITQNAQLQEAAESAETTANTTLIAIGGAALVGTILLVSVSKAKKKKATATAKSKTK